MRCRAFLFALALLIAGAKTAKAPTEQFSSFDQARKFQLAGEFAEAERLYRTFLKDHPASVPALTNLGVVLARQGKHLQIGSRYADEHRNVSLVGKSFSNASTASGKRSDCK